MDYPNIMSMLQNLYQKNPAQDYVTSASAGINQQTKKRAQDLESKYATTGLSRSGISGAALNDVYATGAGALSDVNAKGAEMDFQNKESIINQMLKTQELDDQPSALGGLLGKLLTGGLAVGGALIGGPAGAVAGSELGSGISGFGNTETPNPTKKKFTLNGYSGF